MLVVWIVFRANFKVTQVRLPVTFTAFSMTRNCVKKAETKPAGIKLETEIKEMLKFWLDNGARGKFIAGVKVRGLPKLLGHILWETWISVQKFFPIDFIDDDILKPSLAKNT